jgi:hypothetical protein
MTSGMWNQPEQEARRMAASSRMETARDLVRFGLDAGARLGSAAVRRLRGRRCPGRCHDGQHLGAERAAG